MLGYIIALIIALSSTGSETQVKHSYTYVNRYGDICTVTSDAPENTVCTVVENADR